MPEQIVKTRFISLMRPIAVDEELRSGIKPIITLMQSAHESAWGSSGLTDKANNLFGFTGESWEEAGKPVIKMPTTEYVDRTIHGADGNPVVDENGHTMFKKTPITVLRPFRAYKSWSESVRDWGNLMAKPRYATALAAARAGDVPGFSIAVLAAGYATDPNYSSSLVRVGAEVKVLLDAVA